MKIILLSLISVLLLTSCMGPTIVAWRGTVSYSNQHATTEGRIDRAKIGGDSAVEADKQYSDMLKDNAAGQGINKSGSTSTPSVNK